MGLWWNLRHWCAQFTDWSWYPPKRFSFGLECKVPLAPYFARYAPDRDSDAGFSLRLLRGTRYNTTVRSQRLKLSCLFADGEYGIVLEGRTYNVSRGPLALVSFDLWMLNGDYVAVVKQLQGVSGRKEQLSGIRWERMFLQMVTDWARANGCTEVACIEADGSEWRSHDTFHSFHLRYNVSARRNGFTFDDKRKLWRLPLGAS